MKIEIAVPERMAQTGSSLLKLIQNNDMPVLDLFVRECIQNSLDAKNETDRYVTVKFKTGEFYKKNLNEELEGITDSLNNKYEREKYEFISIMDTNTVGLTGKLHYDEVTDNRYGNLLKLVYDISKAQDSEGAGGSWGLGKTVYFRVGIGLVIYYSRIKKENGAYESRMAACFVEDENKRDPIIPQYNGKSKRGIAWWGEERSENKTQPVRDEVYIEKILNIFGIKPYRNDETGTTIIIPYINKDELLENNRINSSPEAEENSYRNFWSNNIVDYLKISVQRWYSPRLNNTEYPYGKFLRAVVNDEGITKDSMEPAFKIVQALYNIAALKGKRCDDILSESDVKVEKIKLRRVLKYEEAGYVAFIKADRELLKMEVPDNKPSPYEYFNCTNAGRDINRSIVTFTRKPGMLVSYETIGAWTEGIQPCDKKNYIIGVFVLNSENKLTQTKEDFSLEEYVRKGEMADHTSWYDFSIKADNPRIIDKIQGHVRNKISDVYSESYDKDAGRRTSVFGKEFADLLLPPEGFGNKGSINHRRKTSSNKIKKKSEYVFQIDSNIKYTKDGMIVSAYMTSVKAKKYFRMTIGVDADGGNITFDQWNNKMRIKFPFSINNVIIYISEYDGENTDMHSGIIIDKDISEHKYRNMTFRLLNDDNICYGFVMDSDIALKYRINIAVDIKIEKREFNPVFITETERKEK